jgi:hypothetical protein
MENVIYFLEFYKSLIGEGVLLLTAYQYLPHRKCTPTLHAGIHL